MSRCDLSDLERCKRVRRAARRAITSWSSHHLTHSFDKCRLVPTGTKTVESTAPPLPMTSRTTGISLHTIGQSEAIASTTTPGSPSQRDRKVGMSAATRRLATSESLSRCRSRLSSAALMVIPCAIKPHPEEVLDWSELTVVPSAKGTSGAPFKPVVSLLLDVASKEDLVRT